MISFPTLPNDAKSERNPILVVRVVVVLVAVVVHVPEVVRTVRRTQPPVVSGTRTSTNNLNILYLTYVRFANLSLSDFIILVSKVCSSAITSASWFNSFFVTLFTFPDTSSLYVSISGSSTK